MSILAIIAPLLLVSSLGYLATKSQWLKQAQLAALSKFTFSISIPAYLFLNMATANFANNVNSGLFISFYLPVLVVYLLAGALNYYFHPSYKRNLAASAVFSLGASYSNTIIVGLPVLVAAFDQSVVAIIFLIITFHSALLFTITSIISSISNNKGLNLSPIIKNVALNPLIISIAGGLLFNLLAIPIPDIINSSLTMLGQPAITCALFILGGTLSYYQIRRELSFIALAALLKLLILPMLVWFLASKVFMLSEYLTTVVVILTACPIGVNAYLVAANEKYHQETLAGGVVATTLVSIISLSVWLYLLL